MKWKMREKHTTRMLAVMPQRSVFVSVVAEAGRALPSMTVLPSERPFSGSQVGIQILLAP